MRSLLWPCVEAAGASFGEHRLSLLCRYADGVRAAVIGLGLLVIVAAGGCSAHVPFASAPDVGVVDANRGPEAGPAIVLGRGLTSGGGTGTGGQGSDAGPADTGTWPTQCEPVQGTGELATCPLGDVAVGSMCCACTADDCGNPVCCDEPACAADPRCNAYHCAALPPECGGRVDADCDDFPEDCDEPCCPCTSC